VPAFALARLNGDGTADTSLGPNGQVLTNFGIASGSDFGQSVALQADGKIVMAGLSYQPAIGGNEFALARFLPVGPPRVSSQSPVGRESTSTAITLSTTDPNGDPLTFNVTNPANGTLSGSGPNLVYSPNPGFSGTDSFQFNVIDTATGLASDTATVTITVYAPLQPQILGMPATSPEGTQIFLTASVTIPITDTNLSVSNVAWNVTKNGPVFCSPGT